MHPTSGFEFFFEERATLTLLVRRHPHARAWEERATLTLLVRRQQPAHFSLQTRSQEEFFRLRAQEVHAVTEVVLGGD